MSSEVENLWLGVAKSQKTQKAMRMREKKTIFARYYGAYYKSRHIAQTDEAVP